MDRLYAGLCVVGTLIPLYFCGSFVASEGIDVPAFYDEATASDIAVFAWADVVISALAVVLFAVHERSRG